jgi:hypothetical protein
MKKLRITALLVLLVLFLGTISPAFAQTAPPDFTQFGFPRVTATVNYTPGQATTLTAGRQSVTIPADFFSKAVKFEFLEGDASSFPNLGDAQGQRVLTAFAFRVTDTATNQLVGRFDKPVTYSVTNPLIGSASQMYNTSAANPPIVTKNPVTSTVQGTQLSHNFSGAGVGWLVLTPNVPGVPASGAGGTTVNSDGFALYLTLGLGIVAIGALFLMYRLRRKNI